MLIEVLRWVLPLLERYYAVGELPAFYDAVGLVAPTEEIPGSPRVRPSNATYDVLRLAYNFCVQRARQILLGRYSVLPSTAINAVIREANWRARAAGLATPTRTEFARVADTPRAEEDAILRLVDGLVRAKRETLPVPDDFRTGDEQAEARDPALQLREFVILMLIFTGTDAESGALVARAAPERRAEYTQFAGADTAGRERDTRTISVAVRALRERRVARNPHVLVFATPGSPILESPVGAGEIEGATRLERMWARARGALRRLDGAGRARVPIAVPAEARRIYVVLFYEVGATGDDAQYEVEGHAHVALSDLDGDGRAAATLLSGPVGASLEFGADYAVTTPFATLADHTVALSWGDAGDAPAEALPVAPLPEGAADERTRVEFLARAMQFGGSGAEGKVAQTFAYQAYPTEVLDLAAVAVLPPPDDPPALFEYHAAAALREHGLGERAWSELCGDLEAAGPVGFLLFKHVAYAVLARFSAMVYREDSLDGRHVDQMQDARLTGEGDCEDTAQAIYLGARRLLALRGQLAGAAATLADALAAHYAPAYGIVSIAEGMHCIAMLIPLSALPGADGAGGEGRAPPLPILLEGTNVSEGNFRAVQSMHGVADGGRTQTLYAQAAAAWGRVHRATVADTTGDRGDNAWLSARPPADGKPGFYRRAISATLEVGGTPQYVRIRPAEGDAYGVDMVDMFERGRYRLEQPFDAAFTARVAAANAYIADYALPVPLWGAGAPWAAEPLEPFARKALDAIRVAVEIANRGRDSPPAPAEHFRAEVGVPYAALTMSYNLTQVRAAAVGAAAAALSTELARPEFAAAARFEVRAWHVAPEVPIVTVTAFFAQIQLIE